MRIVALVALAVFATTAAARADDDAVKPSYRAVVDRVELEPAAITGLRLRVFLSALAIDGQMLDLTDPKSVRLYLGAGELRAPYALGTYNATGSDTAVVVLVQATQDFAEAMPMIADALDHELIATLGEHAQVAILPYGESVGTAKMQSAKALAGKLGPLQGDGSLGDPALLDALDRAFLLLRKVDAPAAEGEAPHPVRKLVVVIGDGRDRAGDHDRATAAGKRAAKEGVRIHAIAYSPNDVRRPLLLLGELAKRSMGTFRWPGRGRKPTQDSWNESFGQLADEIGKQYVLTYFVNTDDDVAGKRLHVVTSGRTEATSNEIKVPDAPSCGGTACESGYCADGKCVVPRGAGSSWILKWGVYAGGGALGLFMIVGVMGAVRGKRAAAAAAAAQAAIPPNMLPNGKWAPTLLVVNGPLAGQRLYLKNGFLIGKQPGCDLVLDDGHISSQHAQIGMDANGNCALYDRGSTNGTYVNGVPVQQTMLQHGVTIRVGSTELRFLTQ